MHRQQVMYGGDTQHRTPPAWTSVTKWDTEHGAPHVWTSDVLVYRVQGPFIHGHLDELAHSQKRSLPVSLHCQDARHCYS